MISQNRSTRARENYAQPHVVLTNDDLLTEILIRLPILCIHLFTTVSKQYLRILTSPLFILNRNKIPNLDPPAGIFVNHHRSLFECDFVSLDSRLESRKSATDNSCTLGSTEEVDNVKILKPCNGLLMCHGSSSPAFYYVYDSCTNLFQRLPQLENSHDDSHFFITVVFKMAFDPRKSLDYKVVQVGACPNSDLEIQVYSSKTGTWSLDNKQLIPYKLKIKEDHDHPILTSGEEHRQWFDCLIGPHQRKIGIEIPHGLHWGRNFLQSFGGSIGSYDPMLVLIDIPDMLHLEGRLFESRGCLLLVCRDDIGSREFTIYELMKGSSVWTVRYLVNTDEFLTPLPERWSIRSTV
ncbi:hypothetical protein Tco_0799455 [Tanacetum coccineum]|uniref:F-box protein n=1 Tax=Tanacetum coccineum TaxID=301880 RepID=A0ABQ4ZU68_9ASTR